MPHSCRRWRGPGHGEHRHAVLHRALHVPAGRIPQPSVALLDRPAVQTSSRGGPRGARAMSWWRCQACSSGCLGRRPIVRTATAPRGGGRCGRPTALPAAAGGRSRRRWDRRCVGAHPRGLAAGERSARVEWSPLGLGRTGPDPAHAPAWRAGAAAPRGGGTERRLAADGPAVEPSGGGAVSPQCGLDRAGEVAADGHTRGPC